MQSLLITVELQRSHGGITVESRWDHGRTTVEPGRGNHGEAQWNAVTSQRLHGTTRLLHITYVCTWYALLSYVHWSRRGRRILPYTLLLIVAPLSANDSGFLATTYGGI
eukprot:gene9707-biopygen3735